MKYNVRKYFLHISRCNGGFFLFIGVQSFFALRGILTVGITATISIREDNLTYYFIGDYMTHQISEDLQKIFDRLPDLPSRREIAECTGIIAAQTLANQDSEGTGIQGGFPVGRVIRYPKREVIAWLIDYCNKKKK